MLLFWAEVLTPIFISLLLFRQTTLVGFAKNIDYHHRDLIYLLPETSAMWGHQSYYRGPNNSETVLIRKLDPNTGAITFMQSLICQQIRAQTGPGDETL